MNICVTSKGENLDAQGDPLFGRCQYFIFLDTETLAFEAVANPNLSGTGGVGIQSAQFVANKKARAVLTGNVGPNALKVLQAAGIEVILDMSGTVREMVEQYKDGKGRPSKEPSVRNKSGLKN